MGKETRKRKKSVSPSKAAEVVEDTDDSPMEISTTHLAVYNLFKVYFQSDNTVAETKLEKLEKLREKIRLKADRKQQRKKRKLERKSKAVAEPENVIEKLPKSKINATIAYFDNNKKLISNEDTKDQPTGSAEPKTIDELLDHPFSWTLILKGAIFDIQGYD